MTTLQKRFSPDDFHTDRHYWDTFDHNETEVSARWVVMFLQDRGQDWAPFTYADIDSFYKRRREAAGKPHNGFTFNHLIEGEQHRFVTGPYTREMVDNPGGIRIVSGEGRDRVYAITDEFIRRLIKGKVHEAAS